MKKIIFAIAIIFICLISSIYFLPKIVDINQYKDDIEKLIADKTGYDIKIAGKVELKLFPQISIVVNNVDVNTNLQSSKPNSLDKLASVGMMRANIELLPLLSKRVIVNRLSIDNINLNYKVNSLGRNNWQRLDSAFLLDEKKQEENILEPNIKKIIINNANLKYDNMGELIYLSNINIESGFSQEINKLLISGDFKSNKYNFENINIQADLKILDQVYNISNLDISYKDLNLTGYSKLKFVKSVPNITLYIKSKEVDLDLILESAEIKNDQLKQVEKKEKNNNWSMQEYETTILRDFNSDIILEIDYLKYKNFILENINISTNIIYGVLKADIKNIDLYEGKLLGELKIDTTSYTPVIFTDLKLEKISLKDLPNEYLSKIDSLMDVNLNLDSRGNSLYQIINLLNGKMNYELSKGTITGIDFDDILTNAQKVFGTKKLNGRTFFDVANGNLVIDRGIVDFKDNIFKTSQLEVKAKGKINLPYKNIDMKLSPKILIDDENIKLQSITVPVKIMGNFADLKFIPDVDDTVKSVVKSAIEEQIRSYELKKENSDDDKGPLDKIKSNILDLLF